MQVLISVAGIAVIQTVDFGQQAQQCWCERPDMRPDPLTGEYKDLSCRADINATSCAVHLDQQQVLIKCSAFRIAFSSN